VLQDFAAKWGESMKASFTRGMCVCVCGGCGCVGVGVCGCVCVCGCM
jgi:hypothetical protein